MRGIRHFVAVVLCGAGAAVVPAQPAVASDLSLVTWASMSATGMSICATATFSGALIPNITLALQVNGIEEIGLGGGVNPLVAAPVAANLAGSQTLCANFALNVGSTVSASYTAEVVGLSPTPFMGSCAGEAARLFGGSAATVKTC